jgi:hypothetical protein
MATIQSLSSNTNVSFNTKPPSLNMGIFRNIFGSLTSAAVTSSFNAPAKNDRASSEPLPRNGVIDAASSDVHHSQNESHFPLSEVRVSYSCPSTSLSHNPDRFDFQTKPIKKLVNVMEEEEEAQPSPSLCPPSPAATEVDYPESQDIVNYIQDKGTRVHDYAYPSPSVHRLSPVPEIFDQYKGLAEVEYRWSQSRRMYPIQGKTLSRLIDMGWIGQVELSARAAPMDLEELRRHNARQPIYPWKPFRWTTIPTTEERKELTQSRAAYLYQWDRIRAEAEFQEMRRLGLVRETEQVEERIRQRERQKGKGKAMGHKRRLEAIDNGDDSMNTSSDGESGVLEGTDPKRRRLSEDPENLYPAFLIPSKQYPAALHTYDPEIYPEAAYAIGLSSQSQPRAVPPRIDTPPLNEDEDTKHRLVHPKNARALKRQLSRTQTYTQL